LTEKIGRKGKGDKPATSYTFSSIIMYMPLSASLCVATSATEKDFDILVPSWCLFSALDGLEIAARFVVDVGDGSGMMGWR
jgi:hypothetical protein